MPSAAYIHVQIGGEDIDLALLALVEVRQKLNDHWRARVVFRSAPDTQPDVASMFGQPLAVYGNDLQGAQHTLFSGFVHKAELIYEVTGSFGAEVDAVTTSWQMDLSERQAYFLKQTADTAAKQVVANSGLSLKGSVAGEELSRTQWGETDWRFLLRLVDDGEAWLRPTEDGLETQTSFQSGPTLPWRNGESGLMEFAGSGTVRPQLQSGSHYDHRAMQSQTYSGVKSEASFYGPWSDLTGKTLSAGEAIPAATVTERHRATTLDSYQQQLQIESRRQAVNANLYSGVSRSPEVMAGNEITVTGVDQNVDGTYGIVECLHRWTPRGFENHFQATTAKRWFAPQRIPRPKVEGVFPARVTANHDPHNMGRIQVQFHWQDQNATTWARLITSHAGASRGSLMLPEVGDEVAVRFEEGDPERPYLVGSLWNGVQQPPSQGYWDGGTNGSEFAGNNIKRLVTKSGHRITMVDTAGQETIAMATPSSNRLVMTEKANETGRPAIALETAGDIILSAPNGRIHFQSKLQSKEVGVDGSESKAAPSTKHSTTAGPPQIPANCSFLNKGFRVQGKPSQFNAIRRHAKVGKPQKTTFQFPGDSKPQDATSQTITIGGHSVTEIRSVAGPQEKGTVLPSTDTIANALGTVPSTQYGYIKQVVVSPNRSPNDAYWAKTYNMPNFRSEADAGAGGTVHFYPISQNVPMIPDETMIHESGHAFSENIWPTPAAWKDWDDAMKKDGRSVSQYADSSNKEDFSESLVMYSLSKGTPCEAVARKLFPNRYKILDQVLKPKGTTSKPPNKRSH